MSHPTPYPLQRSNTLLGRCTATLCERYRSDATVISAGNPHATKPDF